MKNVIADPYTSAYVCIVHDSTVQGKHRYRTQQLQLLADPGAGRH